MHGGLIDPGWHFKTFTPNDRLSSANHFVSFLIQKLPFQRPPDEKSMWESLQRMRAAAESLTTPAAVCLCSPQQEATPFEFLSDPLWHSRHQLMRLGPSAGYYPNQFTSRKTIFYAVNLLRSSGWTEMSDKNKQRAWPLKIDKPRWNVFEVIYFLASESSQS